MPHFFIFGPQVSERVWSWRNFARKPCDNFNAGISQGDSLAGIICEKSNTFDTEVVQYRGRQAEIPAVALEAQRVIGLNGVDAGILQLISLHFCHQANAAALLIFVNHEATTFRGDGLHGHLELTVAVAAQRPEHLAGEALRMDAQQRRTACQFAKDDCQGRFSPLAAVRDLALESNGAEYSPLGGHPSGGDSPKDAGLRCSHCSVLDSRLRCAFLCLRNGAALAQAVDFARAKAQLLENRLVVLAKRGGTLGRDFRNAMHIDGAADRRGELAACPFERDDDVVRA